MLNNVFHIRSFDRYNVGNIRTKLLELIHINILWHEDFTTCQKVLMLKTNDKFSWVLFSRVKSSMHHRLVNELPCIHIKVRGECSDNNAM